MFIHQFGNINGYLDTDDMLILDEGSKLFDEPKELFYKMVIDPDMSQENQQLLTEKLNELVKNKDINFDYIDFFDAIELGKIYNTYRIDNLNGVQIEQLESSDLLKDKLLVLSDNTAMSRILFY